MLAYHNDPGLKEATLAKIRVHREADRIVKGIYWSERDGVFRGCAVGCLLQDPTGGHERYEEEFGVPVQLAWLEDGIFESLPAEKAQLWPERFMDAIPVGADLSGVWPRFAAWLMVDEKWGLVNITEAEDVKAICRRVAEGYLQAADGNPLSDEDAEELARDTWAARDAWDAQAARVAWVAWVARAARVARVARDEFVLASSDKLVALLGASKPVVAA